MKEILLYSSMWEWTAQSLIKEINAAGPDGIVLRICSPGGGPVESFGVIAKWQAYKGKKYTQTDGKADSTAAYFLCYSDENKALDVSTFLFHRAAYSQWVEANVNYFTQPMKDELNKMNGHLRKAMEAKIDVAKFELIAGFTLDEMFSLDSRLEVTLTAAQAKEIGLVNEIISITPEISAFVDNNLKRIAAEGTGEPAIPAKPQQSNNEPQKNKIMTAAEFKAQNADEYAKIVAEGVTAERERAGAWMEFSEIDAEAVKTGIESGKNLSQKDIAAFAKKSMMANSAKDAEDGNPPAVDPAKPTPEAEGKDANLEAFNKEVDGFLKK